MNILFFCLSLHDVCLCFCLSLSTTYAFALHTPLNPSYDIHLNLCLPYDSPSTPPCWGPNPLVRTQGTTRGRPQGNGPKTDSSDLDCYLKRHKSAHLAILFSRDFQVVRVILLPVILLPITSCTFFPSVRNGSSSPRQTARPHRRITTRSRSRSRSRSRIRPHIPTSSSPAPVAGRAATVDGRVRSALRQHHALST